MYDGNAKHEMSVGKRKVVDIGEIVGIIFANPLPHLPHRHSTVYRHEQSDNDATSSQQILHCCTDLQIGPECNNK
ncbi:hypothetical protein [Segatella bryantii]|uniref:hypothetical protein n=1 Tax=Segatella bryantii TaxID=77095 RepID=UPI001EDB3563|nr:hypothetical protein [Segatella bryantii]UKK82568.1 hypothetical protein L6474_11745 [Segatella bryantii]